MVGGRKANFLSFAGGEAGDILKVLPPSRQGRFSVGAPQSSTDSAEEPEFQATAVARAKPSAHIVRLPHANHYVLRSNEADMLLEIPALVGGLPSPATTLQVIHIVARRGSGACCGWSIVAHSMVTATRDRIRWWPLCAALSLPASAIVAQAISVNLAIVLWFILLGPLLLVIWVAASLWAGVLAVRSVFRKAWGQAAVALMSPIFVLPLALHLETVAVFCNDVADTIHFTSLRVIYEKRIAALPPDGHRLAVFDLGGLLWASRAIVYDETDQIMVGAGHQSADRRARATELACQYLAKPVPGPTRWSRHWYLVYFHIPCDRS